MSSTPSEQQQAAQQSTAQAATQQATQQTTQQAAQPSLPTNSPLNTKVQGPASSSTTSLSPATKTTNNLDASTSGSDQMEEVRMTKTSSRRLKDVTRRGGGAQNRMHLDLSTDAINAMNAQPFQRLTSLDATLIHPLTQPPFATLFARHRTYPWPLTSSCLPPGRSR